MGLGILNLLRTVFKRRKQISGRLPYLSLLRLYFVPEEKIILLSVAFSCDIQSVEMLILYLNRILSCTGGSGRSCYVGAVCIEWWRTCQSECLEPLWFTTSWPELRWEIQLWAIDDDLCYFNDFCNDFGVSHTKFVCQLHRTRFILRSLKSLSYSENSRPCIQPASSLPCLQKPDNGPYPETDDSSPHPSTGFL